MPYKSRTKRLKYGRYYRLKYRLELLPKKRSFWKRQRLEVLAHYSKGKLECACCKEKTYEFLSLDHIKGGGNAHRKRLKSKYILSDLKRRGFPKGFQVLCHNCNLAKGFYGACPHKQKRLKQKKQRRVYEINVVCSFSYRDTIFMWSVLGKDMGRNTMRW